MDMNFRWNYVSNVINFNNDVFDFYAETVTRPSDFWVNLGLEWFIRLVKEPKRMAKRYLYYGPAFVYELLKAKIFGGAKPKFEPPIDETPNVVKLQPKRFNSA